MTSVFDGMGALLADTLGAPLYHIDRAGVRRTVTAVLRETPQRYADQDGREVLVTEPTIKAPADRCGLWKPDDLIIRVSDGQRFRLVAKHPTGNPAGDRTVLWSLDKIAP